MKNYEKAYKEALKVMESLYNVVKYQSSSDALLTTQTLEKAFPELRESEDERIRKELIEFVKSRGGFKHEYIAWLEKQKSIDILDKEEREFADNVDSIRKEIDEAYQKGYNEAYKQGKQDTMKDLPKWKKTPSHEKQTMYGMSEISDIYYNGYFIHLDDIYKALPKE